MLKIILQIGIGMGILMGTSLGYGASQSWLKAASTKVQTQGLKIADGASCETVEAQWTAKAFHIKVRCGSYYFASLYPLTSEGNSHRVAQTSSTVVLTGFAYKKHKIQTQNDRFHALKIPYVNEVVRVEKFEDGSLSIYRETFETDDLGRIASVNSLQVVALAPSDTALKKKSAPKEVVSLKRRQLRAKKTFHN